MPDERDLVAFETIGQLTAGLDRARRHWMTRSAGIEEQLAGGGLARKRGGCGREQHRCSHKEQGDEYPALPTYGDLCVYGTDTTLGMLSIREINSATINPRR